jgi:hypothetical protein
VGVFFFFRGAGTVVVVVVVVVGGGGLYLVALLVVGVGVGRAHVNHERWKPQRLGQGWSRTVGGGMHMLCVSSCL